MQSLRSKLVRLAYTKPQTRRAILALLREANIVVDEDRLKKAKVLMFKEINQALKEQLQEIHTDPSQKNIEWALEWAPRWLDPKRIYGSLSAYYWQVPPRNIDLGVFSLDNALAMADPSFANKAIAKFKPFVMKILDAVSAENARINAEMIEEARRVQETAKARAEEAAKARAEEAAKAKARAEAEEEETRRNKYRDSVEKQNAQSFSRSVNRAFEGLPSRNPRELAPPQLPYWMRSRDRYRDDD